MTSDISGATELIAKEKIVEHVTGIVKTAGQMMLDLYGHTTSKAKGHQDLITEADTALETFVLGAVEKRYPGWQKISEEATAQGAKAIADFCWVLDPLDGTVNFANRVPSFCISLALLYRGDPILGWVYDPLRSEMFTAQRGAGSFLNGERLSIESNRSILIGSDSSFVKWCLESGEGARLLGIMKDFGKNRNLGAQALHLCYVASGRLLAAITRGCRIWDDAAGALIVEEAGGRYGNWHGEDIFPLQAGRTGLDGGSIRSLAATPGSFDGISKLLVS